MYTAGMIQVKMPNNTIWEIPVHVIASDRAKNYLHEFGGNLGRSLVEDTMPLFDEDPAEIIDWAMNNMKWSELAPFATLIRTDDMDYEAAWNNGAEVRVVL